MFWNENVIILSFCLYIAWWCICKCDENAMSMATYGICHDS